MLPQKTEGDERLMNLDEFIALSNATSAIALCPAISVHRGAYQNAVVMKSSRTCLDQVQETALCAKIHDILILSSLQA
jgi:hypothetical protein